MSIWNHIPAAMTTPVDQRVVRFPSSMFAGTSVPSVFDAVATQPVRDIGLLEPPPPPVPLLPPPPLPPPPLPPEPLEPSMPYALNSSIDHHDVVPAGIVPSTTAT